MGGKVEGHREALLSGGEVAAVEGIGISGRGEPGVLPNRPRLVDIHGGVRAPDKGRLTGETIQRIARRDRGITVNAGVERLDNNVLRGVPVQLLRRVAMGGGCGRDMVGRGCRRGHSGGVFAMQWHIGETRNCTGAGRDAARDHLGHAPSPSSRVESASTASIFAVR